jgi:hypothetical protein
MTGTGVESLQSKKRTNDMTDMTDEVLIALGKAAQNRKDIVDKLLWFNECDHFEIYWSMPSTKRQGTRDSVLLSVSKDLIQPLVEAYYAEASKKVF